MSRNLQPRPTANRRPRRSMIEAARSVVATRLVAARAQRPPVRQRRGRIHPQYLQAAIVDEMLNKAAGYDLCTDTCNCLISGNNIYLVSNLVIYNWREVIYKWREPTIVGGTYHNTNFTLFHALSRYFTFHTFHVFHVTRPLFTSRFTPNPA